MPTAAHWAEAYVGIPYVVHEADCARLAERVRREQFAHVLELPRESHDNPFARGATIAVHTRDFAVRTDEPKEGDGVLLLARGRLQHIGIYCLPGGVPHVLHADQGAGAVVLHRVRDLERLGFRLEGYYRWL